MMRPTVMCINGILAPGDIVVSTIDAEYPCMVGRVLEILQPKSVMVDFQRDYSDQRVKQIEEVMSALLGAKKSIEQLNLNRFTTQADCLIRLNESDMNLIPSILKDEKYAFAFAYRTVKRLLQYQDNIPLRKSLRPVCGSYNDPDVYGCKLVHFDIGWLLQWVQKMVFINDSNNFRTVMGLVEMPDGTIQAASPENLRFLDAK